MRLKLHSLKCRILHLCMPRWFCQSNCCVQILWPRNWLGQDLSKFVGSGEKKVPRWLAPIVKNCGCCMLDNCHGIWLSCLCACQVTQTWGDRVQTKKQKDASLGWVCVDLSVFHRAFFVPAFVLTVTDNRTITRDISIAGWIF